MRRRSLVGRSLLAAPLAIAVNIGGCGPGPLDPARTGGELLTGTEDVAYLGGHPFSISPDHRWLVFSSEVAPDDVGSEDHVAFQLARLGAYVSYDLPDRGRAVGFDPVSEAPVWEVVEIDRDDLRAACPLEEATDVPSGPIGPFRLEGAGSPTVRVVDADDASRVYADDPSGFAMALATPAYALRWAPDGSALYAVVEREGATAVYRWFTAEPRTLSRSREGAPSTAVRAYSRVPCTTSFLSTPIPSISTS